MKFYAFVSKLFNIVQPLKLHKFLIKEWILKEYLVGTLKIKLGLNLNNYTYHLKSIFGRGKKCNAEIKPVKKKKFILDLGCCIVKNL